MKGPYQLGDIVFFCRRARKGEHGQHTSAMIVDCSTKVMAPRRLSHMLSTCLFDVTRTKESLAIKATSRNWRERETPIESGYPAGEVHNMTTFLQLIKQLNYALTNPIRNPLLEENSAPRCAGEPALSACTRNQMQVGPRRVVAFSTTSMRAPFLCNSITISASMSQNLCKRSRSSREEQRLGY